MAETLEKWTDELADLRLPALGYNKRRLERGFRRTAPGEPGISRIINQDPGLLLCLFREFSQSPWAPAAPPTDTARIVQLLGKERVRVLARATPAMEERYGGAALKGLKLSYGLALHSAAFAQTLATLRGKPNSAYHAPVGLLQNLGVMALWAKKPGTMNLLWDGVRRPEELDIKSQRRFGVTPSEVGEALASRWGLPAPMIPAQHPHHGSDPDAQLPLLAASLSWAALNDWQSDETNQLIQLAADLTHLEPDKVLIQIHRTAAETARSAYAMGLPHGANRLLLQPLPESETGAGATASTETEADPEPPTTPEATTTPSPPAAAEAREPTAERPVPRQLQMRSTEAQSGAGNPPPRAAALMQRLDGILREMRDELGLERVMLAMLTSELDQLRARFVLEGTRSNIDRFTVSVKSGNLFGMMMRQPHALWIHPANRHKYRSFIPEQLFELFHPDAFFVASILADRRPMGLLYAESSSPLNQQRFDGFKKQCHRIAKLFGDGKRR